METVMFFVQLIALVVCSFWTGVSVERWRRDRELEQRVEERLQKLAEANEEFWETEIDA